MARAQLSIELFFSMLLFTVFFLWLMNYAGVFSTQFGEVSARSQAAALAASVAKTASAVCSNQVNASLQLPCVSRAGQRLGVVLYASNSTRVNATIAGEATFADAIATCPITVSFSSACTNGSSGDWVCLKPSTGAVAISKGRC